MRRILLTLSLLIATLTSHALENLDSLLAVWQDQSQTNSHRAQAYYTYIWDGFLFSNPDTAYSMANELLAFGKKNNDSKAEAKGLSLIGLSYYYRSDYPQALNYYNQSLKLYKQLGLQKEMAHTINNMGLIFYEQGSYPKALEYFKQSLKSYRDIGYQTGIAVSLNNLGNIYFVQKERIKALEYYEQSIKSYEKLDDQRGVADAFNNIGNVYSDQGDYNNALDFFSQSLNIYKQLGDQSGIASALGNIGSAHLTQGDNSKALDFHNQSLKIYKQLGDQNGVSNVLGSIGNTYLRQGDYSNALEFCKEAYDMAVSVELWSNQKKACQCLYDVYKILGNGNEALVYMEKMRVVEDSLSAEETSRKLQQMEFAKQILQDSIVNADEARLIEEAHQEEVRKKDTTRNISFGIGALVLLLALGLYSRLRYMRKSRAALKVEKDRSENLLLNILPAEIAQELKEKGRADARDFDIVSILFTDFKGFTEQSAKLSAAELVNEINHCFEAFDGIIEKFGVEKIKTIGDAYMAAGGLPVPSDDSVKNTVLAALEIQDFISKRKAEMDAAGKPAFEMRVGIHTGPVVAGIVGVKKFQYDIWGDTVNTASRMESAGDVGKVNISQATYDLLEKNSDFNFQSRGKIEAKGKGEIEMYFVSKV